MNIKNLLVAVSALAIVAIAALAQGPLYDKVIVDLPYSVTIGSKVLQPGNYVIRQNPSEGGGGRIPGRAPRCGARRAETSRTAMRESTAAWLPAARAVWRTGPCSRGPI